MVTTANVEIGVDSGSTLTINGGISESGARSLTKSDDGTLTLAGSSTFSGGTTVSQGTLKLTNGSACTGANTVDAGASLVLSGGITASAGQLTISGDGVGNRRCAI